MTIEEGIAYGKEQLKIFGSKHAEFIKMAIHSLEMQKKLAVFSGMDICSWDEDYDDEDNDILQYDYETSVDNFLIDETKEADMNDDDCKKVVTNGDIIKSMFVGVEIEGIRGSIDKDKLLGYRTWLGGRSQDFLIDWWNAPYKTESEDKE